MKGRGKADRGKNHRNFAPGSIGENVGGGRNRKRDHSFRRRGIMVEGPKQERRDQA